jgi:hypothetical protein
MRVQRTNFACFRANQAKYERGGGRTNVINHLMKKVGTLRTACGNFKSLAFQPPRTFYDFHIKKQLLLKEHRSSIFLVETSCFL